VYQFSKNNPEDDPTALWQLQQFLMTECQTRFGNRNIIKTLCQPIFRGDGPIVINTPQLDGAFAALSNNARQYWPTTLYELAHETVHLLNPVEGYTNYLEEGFAVAFSVEISRLHTQHPMKPDDKFYQEAWHLVNQLGKDIYEVARRIRIESVSLAGVNPSQLAKICPNVNSDTIDNLCSECNFT